MYQAFQSCRGSFKALYFKRWAVETKYDEVKQKLEVENFSGILADNIRQDFYAAMTLANIAGGLYEEAQEWVEEEQGGKGNKWKYQVDVNHEIGVLKDRLIVMLLEKNGQRRGAMFEEIIGVIEESADTDTAEPVYAAAATPESEIPPQS
jgi:hypothetical protein